MTKQKAIIVSGIKPSGELHIGNYLGALKNFITLQDEYTCYFFIADLHSLTENFDPKEKQQEIRNLAVDFLSVGLDPKKCTLFIQSEIPEHLELAWILNCLAPYQELTRMTQFKDKAQKEPKNINMGLLDYPVLQAADILLYKPHSVPVGTDQLQHLELTRTLARKFNARFGNTFLEPKPLLTKAPNVLSLTDPTKKMSKSYGPKNYIGIFDEPNVIKEKLARAVTDMGPKDIKKMSAGVANLFLLLEQFSTEKTIKTFHKDYQKGTIKYQTLKQTIAHDIAKYFEDFRTKRKNLLQKQEEVTKVFQEGAREARKVAKEVMNEVREKVGLI